MTVSTIASVASGAIQRTSGNNTYATSIKSLLKASVPSGATADSTNFSTAVSLQTQVSGLRAASLNIAQSAGITEAASVGAGKIGRVLGRLNELAVRASGELSEAARAGLDVEFQALRGEINRIASTTSFNGRNVLDGSVTSESLGVEGGENIANLSEKVLFEGAQLSLDDPQAAAAALKVVQEAQKTTTAAIDNINGIANALELGAVTIESAIQNQEAARSTLTEADLIAASTQNAQQQVESESALSLLAQTNRLPSNILQLLAE